MIAEDKEESESKRENCAMEIEDDVKEEKSIEDKNNDSPIQVSDSKKEDSVVTMEECALALPVKSSAVVKYSAVEVPQRFRELQLYTDLNQAPDNYYMDHQYFRRMREHTSYELESFNAASIFPDCVGEEVDVVSSADNIKKLLKIPLSPSPVSMVVHRIGKTLLLDDFDLSRYMLRTTEQDWSWFRSFLREQCHIQDPDKALVQKHTQVEENLLSNFVYRTIIGEERQEKEDGTAQSSYSASERASGPGKDDTGFDRYFMWKFEDSQMLIGSNLPIFGGGKHPCVSLRLHEASKPISVLTGIDYWLDNLMCNVPEVAMCWHLDGIVQKYEIMKTEELPNIQHASFNPLVIKNVAQNILSFLKSKATKAGHTYWLFRGKNDGMVKLYDLTSLCPDKLEGGYNQNSFTIPVGMLLFRVANNLSKSEDCKKKRSSICTLLKNCIPLLDQEKHKKILCAAHSMLSELYLPEDVDPQLPQLSDHSDEESMVDEDEDSEDHLSSLEIKSLCTSFSKYRSDHKMKVEKIGTDVEDRSNEALEHVLQALLYVKEEERNPVQSPPRPFSPIPMTYSPLKPTATTNDGQECVVRMEGTKATEESWSDAMKRRLSQKASLAFLALAQTRNSNNKFGSMFYLSYLSFVASRRGDSVAYDALALLGDACVYLSAQLSKHKADYEKAKEKWQELERLLTQDFVGCKNSCESGCSLGCWLEGTYPADQETSLETSCRCFEQCLRQEPLSNSAKKTFRKRLAGAQNELGSYYMHIVTGMIQTRIPAPDLREVRRLLDLSWKYLQASLVLFEKLKDSRNVALICSNSGRLMRFYAHFGDDDDDTEPSWIATLATDQNNYYRRAMTFYERGLNALGSRKKYPDTWDVVAWEYCSATYNLASGLQDFTPVNAVARDKLEKQVCELMHKALKYCENDIPVAKQKDYNLRTAHIHNRLASLYHSMIKRGEQRNTRLRQLCDVHYNKSLDLYSRLQHRYRYITVSLEYMHLQLSFAEDEAGNRMKEKYLKAAMNLVLGIGPVMKAQPAADAATPGPEDVKVDKALTLISQNLNSVLMAMIHISTNPAGTKPKKKRADTNETLRDMYRLALRRNKEAICSVDGMCQLMDDLAPMWSKIS